MDFGLGKKSALVMGGSRGLGFAIASELAAEGASVAICGRDADRLNSAAGRIGAKGYAVDLSKPGEAGKLVQNVISDMGSLDVLVVNTGGPPPRKFADADEQDWRDAFEGLWMSSVGAIRSALPSMCDRGWGRIVVVTSIAAREPIANLALSNGFRAGLHGMVNTLSREYASRGITVNAILPGYTLTERLIEVGVDEAKISEQIPAARLGTPKEFAALATFLASDRASYITGQAIACDGGLLHSI
ncbi:MAG: short-chain dehydrogenase/reductase [Rhizobium sp.]|nr:short-chain dehydrogenase/reductase [Rhizobium sp.]